MNRLLSPIPALMQEASAPSLSTAPASPTVPRAIARGLSAWLFRALAATLLMLLLPSCAEEPSSPSPLLYDIVEFTSANTSSTTFTLYPPTTSKPVTLTSTAPIDMGETTQGQSVLLAYTPQSGKAYTSGPINVAFTARITNDLLKKTDPKNLAGWDTQPVWLMALWQGGDKVLMRFRLNYTTEPRSFGLIVDDSTLSSPYPTAYLANIPRTVVAPSFQRQYYAAFDLHALWGRPGCRGLHIRVNNSADPSLNLFTLSNPYIQ